MSVQWCMRSVCATSVQLVYYSMFPHNEISALSVQQMCNDMEARNECATINVCAMTHMHKHIHIHKCAMSVQGVCDYTCVCTVHACISVQ